LYIQRIIKEVLFIREKNKREITKIMREGEGREGETRGRREKERERL